MKVGESRRDLFGTKDALCFGHDRHYHPQSSFITDMTFNAVYEDEADS